MKIADVKKVLNSGERKYSEEELDVIIHLLKRLAEIEYSNNIIRKKQNSRKDE